MVCDSGLTPGLATVTPLRTSPGQWVEVRLDGGLTPTWGAAGPRSCNHPDPCALPKGRTATPHPFNWPWGRFRLPRPAPGRGSPSATTVAVPNARDATPIPKQDPSLWVSEGVGVGPTGRRTFVAASPPAVGFPTIRRHLLRRVVKGYNCYNIYIYILHKNWEHPRAPYYNKREGGGEEKTHARSQTARTQEGCTASMHPHAPTGCRQCRRQ